LWIFARSGKHAAERMYAQPMWNTIDAS
jgi:hypothetical protein